MEFVVICFLLLVGGAILFVPVMIYMRLGEIRRHQDESSVRLTAQIRAVYDAVNQQQKQLEKLRTPEAAQVSPSPFGKKSTAARSATSVPMAASTAKPADHPTAQPPVVDEALVPQIPPVTASGETPIPSVPAAAQSVPVPESVAKSDSPVLPPATATSIGTPAKSLRALASKSAKGNQQFQTAAPPTPHEPNRIEAATADVLKRFEAAAGDVLKRIWNWIIVGEEHVPKGVSVEFAIASQWLLRIGIVLLVAGIGFFLKYSIDHGYLSPTARVVLSVAGGLVMLTAGTRILGGKYHVMGQGLLGGGIATLYFSAFAAANFYNLIRMPVASAAMIGVTALSGFIAVRFHSKLTAVLGVLGGYATPIMLPTEQMNFPGLYGYMLVLGLGVLGVCAWKRWPLLNYLSFAGNFFLVFGSLRDYQAALHFWQVLPFLIAFFVLFSTMVFVFNLFNRTKSNLLDVLVLYLNAGVFFSLCYWLIEQKYGDNGDKWVAAVTLGLTAFYVAHVWYCLVRRVLDRELMLSFTALAAFFLAITVPLLLSRSREWITVSWALQALVMLWVAGKLNSQFLRHVAYGLYVIVLGRFMFLDLPSQYGGATLANLPLADYVKQLGQRLVMFGIPIGSLAMGYRLLGQQDRPVSLTMNRETDIGSWVPNNLAAKAAAFVVFGMLFLYMHLELNRTLGELFPPLRLPVLTLLWLSVCLLLVLEFAKTANRGVLAFLGVFVTGVLLKLLFFDLRAWSATTTFLYNGEYTFWDAGFRLLDFGAIIAFFAFATRLLMRQVGANQQISRDAGIVMGFAGVGMLFLYTTLELNTFLMNYIPNLRSGGISILWTLFALAFLVRGISKDIRPLRYVGLALFALVTWKVFFNDLARLDQLYRIVAFIVLGIMVLSGSFLYLRSRQTFSTESAQAATTGETVVPEQKSAGESA